MKISVLLYRSGDEEGKKLEKALLSAGFRVCRIENLSRLHTILVSKQFDAVLVSHKNLALRCINASRHLWSARSPHTIMEWTAESDGTISVAIHRVPPEVTGIPDEPDKEEKLASITALLSKTNVGNGISAVATNYPVSDHGNIASDSETASVHVSGTGSGRGEYAPITISAELKLTLHTKIRLVLETIEESGSKGTDIPSITAHVWGTLDVDKKKDIQIYISKLRDIFSRSDNSHYTIRYEKKRYYLVRTA